ncbi:Nif3-like dinuclear metal center hexameric protein [Demequina zhanjiangensis]|uniref:GTP cyclohydrolase 1 type 2 homolog n=1 Tax=Demequina zhanjiangensis TaxID=3051659 RepID=A0ABT8G093_9MICO|nr:Nif3-like dinuclear metal center hexameric protein [Demequina sp. SYSU T00b26]MDN4472555.1 Nif3-like dinuclear metal center hexameric protein [Demequina sp. SYSU T00b26]
MVQVSDVIAALDQRYPPRLQESWDRNGLVVGRPDAVVEKVLLAVDPVIAIVEEAVDEDCDLIFTHHPLLLRGVTSVRADTSKGAVVHELIERGIALFNAHTNADAAAGGVADALAADLGVTDTVPLVPDAEDPSLGSGRLGRLVEPMTLHQFVERAANVLPPTAHGVRVAGDLTATVETVAVLGGSGDSFLDLVRTTGADVYVTADLRHHPASEAREEALLGDGRPFLVDVAHSASEWSWLKDAATYLEETLGIETCVSTVTTDPWTARFGATGS